MIRFVGVSKYYKDIVAVSEITFDIDEKEFVFLTGHSGSGKTTLMKMLIRDIIPTEGKIFVEDDDVTRMRQWKVSGLRRKIGIVFQDFKLLQDKNAYENVAFALEANGKRDKEIKEIVPYVMDIVGLKDRMKSFPYELSGGQQQKVALARAIANDPKILVADEPTGNLDSQSTAEIVEILKKVNEWGTTVIMATHSEEIVKDLNKRVLVIENGQLVKDTKVSKDAFAEDMLKKAEQHEKIIVETKPEEKEEVKVVEKESKDKEVENIPPAEEIEQPVSEESEEIITEQTEETEDVAEKEVAENLEEPVKQEKKPKLKIGLSSKKKKPEKAEEKESTKEEKPKSTVFEDNGISNSTIKLLQGSGYNNIQDIMNAGIEQVNLIDDITGDQIREIEKAIDKFIG